MEYKHSTNIRSYGNVVVFASVMWCFCPRKCTSLIIYGQVVYPNIFKCQLCMRLPPLTLLVPSVQCTYFIDYSMERVSWFH